MDIKIIFIVLTIIVATASFFPYFRNVFLLKTKPHIYTWLVFTIISVTSTVIGFQHGGGLGTIGLLFAAILNGMVFIFALKYNKSPITKIDTFFLFACLIAIFIWWQLNDPLTALLTVTAIRALSYIPTIRKSYYKPWDETILSWIGFTIGNIFTILALRDYNVLTLTYLITISIFNLIVVITCLVRRKSLSK